MPDQEWKLPDITSRYWVGVKVAESHLMRESQRVMDVAAIFIEVREHTGNGTIQWREIGRRGKVTGWRGAVQLRRMIQHEQFTVKPVPDFIDGIEPITRDKFDHY